MGGIALDWATSQLVGKVRLGGSAITPVGLDDAVPATGNSIAVGQFIGIYPATRVASLEPVVALRHD